MFLNIAFFFAPPYALYLLARQRILRRRKAANTRDREGLASLRVFAGGLLFFIIIAAVGCVLYAPDRNTSYIGMLPLGRWVGSVMVVIPLALITRLAERVARGKEGSCRQPEQTL